MATRWLRRLWRILGSIRLAAALLFALLLTSVVGSLFSQMPDDPSVSEPWLDAVRLRYGPATGLWQALGLFDVYRSPLFLIVLAALLVNTLVCTVQCTSPLCRSLTRTPVVIQSDAFYQEAAMRAEWPVARGGDAVDVARQSLARRGYQVLVDGEADCAHICAERGKWGRLGSPVSHAAAVCFFLALLARPALSCTGHDPTFWPAVAALSVFLVATSVSLWMPHQRLWLRVDAQRARMAGVGDFGLEFNRLAELLSEMCGEAQAGRDG
jgi:hypothetical protein